MPEAEGRVFSFDGADSIRSDFLETIDHSGNPQNVVYSTEEFSAVCPFSGLPDFARLEIEYIPGNKILELKSLKYYIVSYRNVGIYQEAATDRIFNDLRSLLTPRYLMVRTVYNVRGGIHSTCTIDTDMT